MSAKLLYKTSNIQRFEELRAICASENYALSQGSVSENTDLSGYELVFVDAHDDQHRDAHIAAADTTINKSSTPVVAIYNTEVKVDVTNALSSGALDVLAHPFDMVETVSRVRCLSRLKMLQDELASHHNLPQYQLPPAEPVLLIGAGTACHELKLALEPNILTQNVADDMTGLLMAAQGRWSCIILALTPTSREPEALVRQLRALVSTRTTPILVSSPIADARCVAALNAGANDFSLSACSPAELTKRVSALAYRKLVLDALQADAAAITPKADFDHATGLPGPAHFMRSMPASLERLKAQGKSVSLLLIAVDAIDGLPVGQPISDTVMLALTQILRSSLRGFDYACRYSANCFAILMPGADAAGAKAVAIRICAEIKSEKVRRKDGRKDGTTASIGLATAAASGGAASAADMLAIAADSLALAQAKGLSQVVVQQLSLAA